MITNIEDARMLSVLTDRPHIIEDINCNKKMVAFAGIILPLGSFSMMFMWALAGSNYYHKIFQEQADLVEECFRLNPGIINYKNFNIGPHIVGKFKEVLGRLDPADIEELVDHMFVETEGS
jgi:hypothetical protein